MGFLTRASAIAFSALFTLAPESRGGESVQFAVTVHGHTIKATLSSMAFKPNRHRIESALPGSGETGMIDGKPPIGLDRMTDALTEFNRFEVKWDGKAVAIPPSIYRDCFNPNLKRKQGWWDDKGTIYFLPSEDGSSLLIQMQGSDGAGSYFVSWIISRDGSHSRFIDEEIP